MLRMSLGVILAGGLSLVAATSADANTDAAARLLVPHRAIYDLKLKNASERSGIEGMFGRMVYEFTGSACTGFSTNFRLVTKINTGEETRLSDQQTTTFEDMAANQFHFETKSFTDEQLDKQLSGDASIVDKGIKVEITQPDGREIELPSSDFPTSHMLDVIANAKQGKSFFEARVFDGSENGDQALLTTTVIGKSQTAQKDDVDADKAGEFAKSSFWPVTIAYFNENAVGDPTPVYNMSFKLYENGITRDLTMDYGDFVLSGSLAKLELLKPQQDPCPAPAK
ncbi:cell envelope integrity EipB family protein [Neorhizobium galegae]|uniref:cell envelope integrity EipB family protein n=1 Tax=Neorhizobium galegae TaxID=399 RepID=UPI0006223BCF|nr:cell envelope integrity EipB family protein [Neorhizobium galegae]CDZ29223.1 ATP/GTP-binding site motif A (P-loop) [Neorhizobium galegae bv. officinalis]KAA9387017.1 cell envelope integrity EipB family protein [Neorhizobium galegae]KAB1116129.1 cell envelope integrity EipB family protein [Neorhizobium galegae]MCM2500004.1 cell envelope integrity EipB family protein [Neorhizobium galegae]MCQ1764888.1 cell envelope integrity EipB family protein [Neorhizobium galegae]